MRQSRPPKLFGAIQMKTNKEEDIISFLHEKYPDAKTSLRFSSPFECLVAISLSAQSTDKAVNEVTPSLFEKYPTSKEMSKANISDVENIIHSLGLYRNKAKNIISLSYSLEEKYGGRVPFKREELITLPGVGNKTACVFLLEMNEGNYFPVDTHVSRISLRLGYSNKNDEPLSIQRKLEKKFPEEEWNFLHHAFIYFGRDICKAQKPSCEKCMLGKYCSYLKKHSSTAAK